MSSFFDEASLVMIPSGYKDQKVYSVKPLDGSGDLTFSRASSATRVASNGLIEKVRTNLILQSQAFNTTWTTNDATVTANTTANPLDGAVNADTITLTGGSSQKRIQQSIAQNGTYTQSVYLKAGTHQFVQFLVGNDVSPYVNFDLVNGTRSGAFGSSANIVSVGNGWYRCSMSYSTSTGSDVYIWAVDSLSAARADATSSTGTFFAFGYQFETGDIVTDYIATTTAAVSVGPVSGLPRLDYLGSTCGKLLLEPQRTNLALYSEQFNNAAWVQSVPSGTLTLTSNYAVSPDGYQNADRLQYTGGSQYVQLYQILTHSTNVFSIYAKSNTGANQSFRIWGNDFAQVSSNLTVTSSWQRFDFVITGTGSKGVGIATASTGAALDISIYGAQFEAGAYATSYIPTLGTSVTRVADAASKTGISSLIGQTEGTIYWEGKVDGFAPINESLPISLFATGATVSGPQIYVTFLTNGRINYVVYDGTTVQALLQTTTSFYTLGTNIKIAAVYKANDFALYINGVQIGTDTSGSVVATSELYLDYKNNAGNYSTSQLLLFKTRLTNAQLAELTTL